MKLVVVGGTGLVATELIRQSLRAPEITSVVALARRPVQLDADTSSTSKFESVVVHDYAQYTDSVKAALAGADACIWYFISSLLTHICYNALLVRLMYQTVQDCGDHDRPIQHLRLCRGEARVSGLYDGRARGAERGQLYHVRTSQVCLLEWTWNLAGFQYKTIH